MRAFPATGASSPRRTARRAFGSEGRESRSPLQARAHEQISMRGKTPQEPADLARGRPTQKTDNGVSEVQPGPAHPSGGAERGRRTWEARGAAERGRGQHVSPRAGGRGESLSRGSGGAGDRRAGASRKRWPAGSLPDGDANGSIDRTRRRIVGSRPHGRSTDLANMWPGDELSRMCAARVRPDHVRPANTEPVVSESKL